METHDVNLKEDRMCKYWFEGVVQFLDGPDLAEEGSEALAAAGVKFTQDPTMIDPVGPTVFGTVSGETMLNQDALWNQLRDYAHTISAAADLFFHLREEGHR